MGESKKTREDQCYALIMINERRDETDSDDVFIGVNGKNILLKRSEYIPVTASVVDILKNATQPVVEKVDKGVVISRTRIIRQAKRYPYQFFCWLSQDEYDYLRDIAKSRAITDEEANSVIYMKDTKAA